MDIDYESIYKTIKIGDKEQLKYNGYPKVPKYMDGDTIIVVGFTKKKVKVNNGYETFNVRFDQIRRVSQEIRNLEIEYFKNLNSK